MDKEKVKMVVVLVDRVVQMDNLHLLNLVHLVEDLVDLEVEEEEVLITQLRMDQQEMEDKGEMVE